VKRLLFLLVLLVLAGCPHPTSKPEPPPPEKVVQLNADGQLVDIEASFVPGYVTVVDFWASWCKACKVMEKELMARVGDEPRIIVRKVDVGDGDTPVAEHYGIGALLPHLRVYDTQGVLRYTLIGKEAIMTGEKALEVLEADTTAAK
jgi:thiol-disulfide isomerase/thioredoxin